MTKEISFYKFNLIFFRILVLFCIFHLMVWSLYTSKIFDTKPYTIGDLGRMSYSLNSLHYRLNNITLPKKMISYDMYSPNMQIDIVTIGDSFSNGAASGLNPYYQDHLASETNSSILNIQNIDDKYTYIETINALLDKGWFDKVKPKVIILETVARRVSNEYSKKQDWNIKLNHQFELKLYGHAWRDFLEKPLIINTANYKLPYYNFMYQYQGNAQEDVYKFKLNKNLFSVKASNILLVYKDDIQSLSDFESSENIKAINGNMNKLALRLKEKGIKLYFMPVVDKYDLYSQYIIDNPHKKNKLFESLAKLNKEYNLINTKLILEPLLKHSTLDIYYADDTHWSYKSSSLIAKQIKKEIIKCLE